MISADIKECFDSLSSLEACETLEAAGADYNDIVAAVGQSFADDFERYIYTYIK